MPDDITHSAQDAELPYELLPKGERKGLLAKIERATDKVVTLQAQVSALAAQVATLEQQVAEYRAALADIAAMKWEDVFGVTEIASGDLDAKTLGILAALGAHKEEGEMSIGTFPQVSPILDVDDLQKTLELLRQQARKE